ncbi:glycoside hydrolase family 61 protein [Fomitiporia mediterranea MF3/22]|uniref:glycoside hydrolase family 61 protein n=1 Tax=Fomitiporia mediterranea (strain MF3/22) TaxID=694068 RepID=UPI0004409BD9|nr:glycoside hydrolase family 61 protein [Fomitiporia mediterranea MF3/22]EJD03600.1 glycoside hydrolase family 61 protein [Fomitiporia mediterranea MF3/22]
MRSFAQFWIALGALATQAAAHYTFPSLVVDGTTTPAWVNVRQTNNYNTQAPVTDVTSMDIRCYDTAEPGTAETITVSAGQQIGIMSDGAKAPGDVDGWAGDGAVWFKLYEIPAVTDGGKSITFPAEGQPGVTFTLPSALPSGQYLLRMENIALHVAQSYGGAQFYLSCGQINVENGGSGTPGPTVAFPGAYTGYAIPTNYTQPGPPVWTG